MKFCLVKNGSFVRKLPHNQNVDWDANTTLPPSALSSKQRASFGVFTFVPSAPVPPRHKSGAISYDVGHDTVTENISHRPLTSQELEVENNEVLQNHVDNNKFFKAFALVAAEQWGMTPAQLKVAIKAKL